MTDIDTQGYERLLADFGRALDVGAQRHVGRRRDRRRASAGAALLVAIAAGVLIASGGGSHLDVVAQARAALAPAGQIVHLRTTTHIETEGKPGGSTSTAQQWSTASPPRWRVSTSIPTPTTTPGGKPVGNSDGLVTGAMQFSYGDGTQELYLQQINTLEVTTGLAAVGPQAAPYGPLGVEPVATVRAMLEAGRLHDAGSGVVNGRTVRRLVGAEPRGSNPSWPVEYDVNPRTDAPVRVTIEAVQAARRAGVGVPLIVLDVDSYELLPLNGSTVPLLTIRPAGNPTIHRYRAGGR
jgi:hypothetical protein